MAKPINVIIKGDYTDRDVNRAIRDLERLRTTGTATQTGLGRLSQSLRSNLGPAFAMAAAAAGAAAVAIGVDAVKAFMDDQRAATSLAQTISNLGFDSATADVEAFIDTTQRATGVADDQLRPAMDRLLRATNSVSESQRLLDLSLNISAGTGKSLQAVVEALSKAQEGQFTGLRRLGAGLDDATLKTKDMDLITAKLARTFEGQAAVAAETMSGKLQRLGVAADELKEALGRGIVEGFLDAMDDGIAGTDDLMRSMKDLEPITERLGRAIGEVAASLTNTALMIEEVGGWFDWIPGPIKTALGWLFSFEGTISRIYRGLVALGIIKQQTEGFGVNLGSRPMGLPSPGRDTEHLAHASAGLTRETDKLTTALGGSSAAKRADNKATQELQRNVDSLSTSLQGLIEEVQGTTVTAGKASFDGINKQIDAFKSMSAEAKSFAQEIVSSFMGQLDLEAAIDQAKAAGTSIVEEFAKQGEKAAAFGAKMQEVLRMGLSKAAMRDIMALGFDRGMDVMNELTTGAVEANIANINKVYTSVETMANQVADQAKAIFYDAGLNLILSTLRAMISELLPTGKTRRLLLAMMDDLAASMNRTATITVGVVYAGAAAPPSSIVSGGVSVPTAGLTSPEISDLIDGILSGGGIPVPMFAEGGIATSPTPGIFGEAGPEALIPLDRMGDFGGSTYNITVNAGVGDPRAIGRSVVEAITLYERASGPVFARA